MCSGLPVDSSRRKLTFAAETPELEQSRKVLKIFFFALIWIHSSVSVYSDYWPSCAPTRKKKGKKGKFGSVLLKDLKVRYILSSSH